MTNFKKEKCKKCGADLHCFDDQTDIVIDCDNHCSISLKTIHKQSIINDFVCEDCGCKIGQFSEDENEIRMTCDDCGKVNIILVKPKIYRCDCDYSKSNNEEIKRILDENRKRREEIERRGEIAKAKWEATHPHCPTCGSSNIEKISATSKAVGAVMFGLFSKTAKSQFKCKNCGYKW